MLPRPYQQQFGTTVVSSFYNAGMWYYFKLEVYCSLVQDYKPEKKKTRKGCMSLSNIVLTLFKKVSAVVVV